MTLVKQNKKRDGNIRLMTDRRGLSTVEYVIILALIAITAIAAWDEFGTTVTKKVRAEEVHVNGLRQDPIEE